MQNKIGGIILAAGESSRMGKPKALLLFPDKKTLLTAQAQLLRDAGCQPVVVVVGAGSDVIVRAHPHLEVSWCVNKAWETGQFSSIHAGVSHLLHHDIDGVIILPVDTAGVKAQTLVNIMKEAEKNPSLSAVVPVFNGKGGHPVYLTRAFCVKVAESDPQKDRLDILLHRAGDILHLPVDDEAILKNINTPDEWERNCSDASSL